MYIGSSKNLSRRFSRHKCALRRNEHPNEHLQRAWNKYGEEMFSFAVVEYCSTSTLIDREYDWVMSCNTLNPKHGYNKDIPGNTKYKTEYYEERNTNGYVNHQREKVNPVICVEASTGKVVEYQNGSLAAEAIGIPFKRMYKSIQYWRNKGGTNFKRSINGWMAMYKADYDPSFNYLDFKMANKQLGVKHKGKAVIVTELSSSVETEFQSISDAAKALNLSRPTIAARLSGKRNASAPVGGYTFKYKAD